MAWAAYPPFPAAGSGPEAPIRMHLVLLHDAGSGSREFQPLTQQPPAQTRLILIDWPGHGSSGAPDTDENPHSLLDRSVSVLHSALRQLAISQAVLLGSGFGAAVAIRFASLHPGAVLGLILTQPAGLIASKSGRSRPLASCLPILAQSKRNADSEAVLQAIRAARRHTLRLEALKPEMQPLLDAADSELKRSQPDLRRDLVTLEQPVLFGLSRDSRKFPLRSYLDLIDPLLARSPQHRITVFTGSLNPAWDEPQRFAQAVNGFIQSQLPLALHQHAWLLTAVDYPAENMNLWKCVHPDCTKEQALPAEANPNAS